MALCHSLLIWLEETTHILGMVKEDLARLPLLRWLSSQLPLSLVLHLFLRSAGALSFLPSLCEEGPVTVETVVFQTDPIIFITMASCL